MRFHPTIEENGKRLKRLAALLFALADLAERAAGSSSAVCLLLLWLLRPSEAIARELVENLAPGAARLPEPVRHGDGTAEALRLAQSFRSLAAILAALAEHCLALRPAAFANRRPAGFFAAPAMRPACHAAVGWLDSS
jgi:hypothetical protein